MYYDYIFWRVKYGLDIFLTDSPTRFMRGVNICHDWHAVPEKMYIC